MGMHGFFVLIIGGLLAWAYAPLLAQPTTNANATIIGKVISAETGQSVVGASISWVNSWSGVYLLAAHSDLDGNFVITDLPQGIYHIEVTAMGYGRKRITGVKMHAGERLVLDLIVERKDRILDFALIETADLALQTLRRKSPTILDGVSSAQMLESNDQDASVGLQRVSSILVSNNQQLLVRGMHERYSKYTLNGAEVQGLDLNQNTLKLDLFPANFIDNMLIYKVHIASLAGNFASNNLDISTKDIPERFTLQFNAYLGYNTLASFNQQFLLNDMNSPLDGLALGAKTRNLPNFTSIPTYQQGITNANDAQTLVRTTNSFPIHWSSKQGIVPFNYNTNFSIGNKVRFLEKELGIIGSLSYQQQYNFYEKGLYAIYTPKIAPLQDSVQTKMQLSDNQSTSETLLGAMLGFNYKLSPYHKIGLLAVHNQNSTQTIRTLEGQKDNFSDTYQTQTFNLTQRRLSVFQVKGKHIFITDRRNVLLDWQSSLGLSAQQEPDVQYFSNRWGSSTGQAYLRPSADMLPARFERLGHQTNFFNKAKVEIPFVVWNKQILTLETGASYSYKSQNTSEKRYFFNNQDSNLSESPRTFWDAAHALQWNDTLQQYANNGTGRYVFLNSDSSNTYKSLQHLAALYAYAAVPLSSKWHLTVGFRTEFLQQFLQSESRLVQLQSPNTNGKKPILQNFAYLPSLILNYQIVKKWKARFAYTRTVSRPMFRELAPFSSFEVAGGYVLGGNPDLKPSTIDHLDMRLDYYIGYNESVSLTGFYKRFTNAFERALDSPNNPNKYTWRNASMLSFLAGIELDIRKNLKFITPSFKNISIVTNLAYIYSQTTMDSLEYLAMRSLNPQISKTRAMFGQAPFSIHAGLAYQNKGTCLDIGFNMLGARIAYLQTNGLPAIYEQPRPWLTFSFSQKIGKHFSIRLIANNLLNTSYRASFQYQQQTYSTQQYALGQTFQLGVRYEWH